MNNNEAQLKKLQDQCQNLRDALIIVNAGVNAYKGKAGLIPHAVNLEMELIAANTSKALDENKWWKV